MEAVTYVKCYICNKTEGDHYHHSNGNKYCFVSLFFWCMWCSTFSSLSDADACLCFCACTNGYWNLRQQPVRPSSSYPCTFASTCLENISGMPVLAGLFCLIIGLFWHLRTPQSPETARQNQKSLAASHILTSQHAGPYGANTTIGRYSVCSVRRMFGLKGQTLL